METHNTQGEPHVKIKPETEVTPPQAEIAGKPPEARKEDSVLRHSAWKEPTPLTA